MTFLQWPEHRQRVADTLLLIESALSRAGCNWVVEKIKDTGHIATDAQIFAAICNVVETFEQLQGVFAERDRAEAARAAERDVREARQQTPASAKPSVAA